MPVDWQVLREAPVGGDATDLVGTNVDFAANPAGAIATASTPFGFGQVERGTTRTLVLSVVAKNSSGVILNRASCTFHLALVEDISLPGESPVLADSALADEPLSLSQLVRVPFNGARRWSVLLTAVANAPATTDHFEIRYRPADV